MQLISEPTVFGTIPVPPYPFNRNVGRSAIRRFCGRVLGSELPPELGLDPRRSLFAELQRVRILAFLRHT